jgi:type I restriction-modification system DNA methylase subunit
MSSSPPRIVELVETFERNIESYKGQGYSEAQVRQQFINPFFEALGWDMQNKAGIAPAYSDVIHEDAIKVGAPDYCFRIGGTRKFFLEAKKPSVDISSGISPAYQLRRYAWSTKLPLSILTDFEDFAVYDCQIRPNINDKPSTARIFFCTYKDYADKWEQIASIFSKEAVLKGAFDKYASEKTTKRGTTTVDKEFLAEIEGWRNELAKNIAIRNGKLSVYDLNFAVQKTIDRILFLRICEDRGIERTEQLLGLINGSRIYPRLFELFEKADEKYNSGIFHFRMEKDRPEGPDEISANLKVDDDVLKKIIKDLYYPCPYVFSEMPVEILGNVYEQFLGKVIRLTAGHQAKVEEKPEVKKAGGVYYTPSYIVDYIVKNTVGKLCENKTPKQIKKLKILDPACGSGSFLIGAYRYLLDFHRDYYAKEPSKHKKVIYQGKGKQWFLMIDEKKRILLNNIYGVDIDSQAAEVTKLSLLLKVLENETQESLRLFHERALPDLGNNIKCGNSLIGPDFYQNQQLKLFGDEQQRKINAFDWQKEFAEIFSGKNPGFDAVIGNPPYLYSAGQSYPEYFARTYHLAQYQADFYAYFTEKALSLTRSKGKFSFIVSDSWLKAEGFSKLRNHLLTKHRIESLVVFDYTVFAGATIENSIFVVTVKEKPLPIPIGRFSNPNICLKTNEIDPVDAAKQDIINPMRSLSCDKVIAKIEQNSKPLENFLRINRGIHAYRTDGYGKSKFGTGPQTKKDKEACSYHANKPLNKTYLPELKGKDIFRFTFSPTGKFLSYGPWLAEPREPNYFFNPKITLRKIIGPKLSGTYIEEPVALDQSLYVLISKSKEDDELKYFLGILLSRLAVWYLRTKFAIYDTLYPWYTKKQLAAFPVKEIDTHLIRLVEQMLELNKKLTGIKNPDEKTRIQRQIDAADAQIDKLVYDLYNLTPEEIKLVEEASQ